MNPLTQFQPIPMILPGSAHRKRQSRFRPDAARAEFFRLQPRDIEILREVLEDRFLTADQIGRLFFSSYSSASKRLQKLWNAGYIRRDFAPVMFGSSPAVYTITQKGVDALRDHLGTDIRWSRYMNYVRPHTKLHEIECNDVKIAFVTACRNTPGHDDPVPGPGAGPRLTSHDRAALDQSTPPRAAATRRASVSLAPPDAPVELLRFENCDSRRYWDRVRDPRSVDGTGWLPIRPDRFMILKIDGKVEPFFIEVDRGTESLTRIREKIRAYKSYYFSGRYAQRYRDDSGHPLPSYRVLWIAPSDERRDNLCRQALLENSPRMHWFTTKAQASSSPLALIWLTGKVSARNELNLENMRASTRTLSRERPPFLQSSRVPSLFG